MNTKLSCWDSHKLVVANISVRMELVNLGDNYLDAALDNCCEEVLKGLVVRVERVTGMGLLSVSTSNTLW